MACKASDLPDLIHTAIAGDGGPLDAWIQRKMLENIAAVAQKITDPARIMASIHAAVPILDDVTVERWGLALSTELRKDIAPLVAP